MTFKSAPNAKALRPASHLIKWKPIDVFQNDGRIDLAWINVEVFVWRFSLKKVFLKISQNPQENTCAMVCFKKVAGLLWLLLSIENGLTHFISPVSFNSPWKHQKTSDFLMFSSSIKRGQLHELGKSSMIYYWLLIFFSKFWLLQDSSSNTTLIPANFVEGFQE